MEKLPASHLKVLLATAIINFRDRRHALLEEVAAMVNDHNQAELYAMYYEAKGGMTTEQIEKLMVELDHGRLHG